MLLDENDYYILYEITNLQKILPNLKNEKFIAKVKEMLFNKSKFEFNSDLIKKISEKKFIQSDFEKLSNNNLSIVQIDSIKDDKKFTTDSIKYLYTKSKNNFALVSDKDNNIYLIKIIDIKYNNISKNAKNFLQYKKQANDQIKGSINDSYDFFINSKYTIKINEKTLERVKKLFSIMINRSFKDFKKKHQKKINQVIYSSISVENENFLINLINNFLSVKNSFVFESVEKGKIRGRYTIFGKDPDKIWEFNNNDAYSISSQKKRKISGSPEKNYRKNY